MSANEDFERRLEDGRHAEELVDHVLREQDFMLMRSSDLSGPFGGQAPRLHGRHGWLVLPDRQAFKAGVRRWAEVKRKATATFHRVSNEWEHGFAQRLWNHYEAVESETGTPLWLFVYEDNTGCLLHGILGDLAPSHIYDGNKMDRGGTVFFRRSDFALLEYDPLLRSKFGLPEPTHKWEGWPQPLSEFYYENDYLDHVDPNGEYWADPDEMYDHWYCYWTEMGRP
jgi:hypothetical protein